MRRTRVRIPRRERWAIVEEWTRVDPGRILFGLHFWGMRDLLGRFTQATEDLFKDLESAVTHCASVMAKAAAEKAPRGERWVIVGRIPNEQVFLETTERLRKSIEVMKPRRVGKPKRPPRRPRGRKIAAPPVTPWGVETWIRMMRHGYYTIHGLKPHMKRAKRARCMVFYWPNPTFTREEAEKYKRMRWKDVPLGKRVLRGCWWPEGRRGPIIFTVRARHPGYEGRRWDLDVWEQTKDEVVGIMMKVAGAFGTFIETGRKDPAVLAGTRRATWPLPREEWR